jgi:hypothetical protein
MISIRLRTLLGPYESKAALAYALSRQQRPKRIDMIKAGVSGVIPLFFDGPVLLDRRNHFCEGSAPSRRPLAARPGTSTPAALW